MSTRRTSRRAGRNRAAPRGTGRCEASASASRRRPRDAERVDVTVEDGVRRPLGGRQARPRRPDHPDERPGRRADRRPAPPRGDNFQVDLDLSEDALPVGTKLGGRCSRSRRLHTPAARSSASASGWTPEVGERQPRPAAPRNELPRARSRRGRGRRSGRGRLGCRPPGTSASRAWSGLRPSRAVSSGRRGSSASRRRSLRCHRGAARDAQPSGGRSLRPARSPT